MNLKIRLLENMPESAPKLFNEMHISAYSQCGDWKLSLTPDGTLKSQTNGEDVIMVAATFVHRSRIFYINNNLVNKYEILSDTGKFLSFLPMYFSSPFEMFWESGDFISYHNFLLFVPSDFLALLISEEFFREYEIIPILSKALLSNITTLNGRKSILMFQNELLAITELGDRFYDEETWKNFEMDWSGLNPSKNIKLMVVYTKNDDQLFAFSGLLDR